MTRYFCETTVDSWRPRALLLLLRGDLERKLIKGEVFAIVCDDAIDEKHDGLHKEEFMSYQLDAMNIFSLFDIN